MFEYRKDFINGKIKKKREKELNENKALIEKIVRKIENLKTRNDKEKKDFWVITIR